MNSFINEKVVCIYWNILNISALFNNINIKVLPTLWEFLRFLADAVLPGTPHIISRIISRPQRAVVASGSSATINQISDLIWLPGITVPEKCSSLFKLVSCYCHKSSGLCLYHLVHNLLNHQNDNIHKDKGTVCRYRGVSERRRLTDQ